MKFGAVDIQQASGKILAHNLSDLSGKRRLRKGTVLEAQHLALLGEIGLSQVYVAELEDGEMPEQEAAPRIAACLAGERIELQGAATGRTNLIAKELGIVQVDRTRLEAVNLLPGVTVATLFQHRVVSPKMIVASVKIIPYGIPMETVDEVERICAGEDAVIEVLPLQPKDVALILTGRPGLRERLEQDFKSAISKRVTALGSRVTTLDFLSTDTPEVDIELATMIQERVAGGSGLIIVAGETAILDERDILPRAIVRAGGEIESLGAPVDPGNLLLLGYLGVTPILGAPGCARSRKENVVDWILPRLLAGQRLHRVDIVALGHGGLLLDDKDRT